MHDLYLTNIPGIPPIIFLKQQVKIFLLMTKITMNIILKSKNNKFNLIFWNKETNYDLSLSLRHWMRNWNKHSQFHVSYADQKYTFTLGNYMKIHFDCSIHVICSNWASLEHWCKYNLIFNFTVYLYMKVY